MPSVRFFHTEYPVLYGIMVSAFDATASTGSKEFRVLYAALPLPQHLPDPTDLFLIVFIETSKGSHKHPTILNQVISVFWGSVRGKGA
jgi:hypothetical protein